MPLSPLTSRPRIAAVLLVAATILAACGGGGDDPEPTTTLPTTTTTTAPPPPAPLTGLPEPDDERRERPALMLKVDNHDQNARPQAGLNQADVVFEEQVEGGVTRLAAVFQSEDADRVGPIRSGRTTDIDIVTMLNRPLFGFSGANAPTLQAILASPIVDVRWDARPDDYRRDRNRPAPHHLFTSTAALYEAAPDDAQPPPSLFQYVTEIQGVQGDRVESFRVSFGSGYFSTWTWDDRNGVWERAQIDRPHVDEDGEQIAVPNVIVQLVQYGSRFGNPEAELVGEGDVWVFTRGEVIKGRWRRASAGEVTRYLDDTGADILLTAGRTWVELPSVGRLPEIDYGAAGTAGADAD
jgi:hypothetical protein